MVQVHHKTEGVETAANQGDNRERPSREGVNMCTMRTDWPGPAASAASAGTGVDAASAPSR